MIKFFYILRFFVEVIDNFKVMEEEKKLFCEGWVIEEDILWYRGVRELRNICRGEMWWWERLSEELFKSYDIF